MKCKPTSYTAQSSFQTSIFLPSTIVPFNFSRAFIASAEFANVTNPNPYKILFFSFITTYIISSRKYLYLLQGRCIRKFKGNRPTYLLSTLQFYKQNCINCQCKLDLYLWPSFIVDYFTICQSTKLLWKEKKKLIHMANIVNKVMFGRSLYFLLFVKWSSFGQSCNIIMLSTNNSVIWG